MSEGTSNPTFSEDNDRALAGVLDEIIPASSDGRLPGAGELGLASHIDQALQQAPELRPVIAQGLSGIADLASRRNSQGFAALPKQDKLEVLSEIESREPAFLPSLIFLTYTGYYRNGRVVEALGLEPRPPHPKGYEVEENDLTLLDGVRQRPKLYREG
jgi:hypothetical protein